MMQILAALATVVILGLGAALYLQSKPSILPDKSSPPPSVTQPQSPKQPTSLTKTYNSKNLKFTIEIPINLAIEEKFTTVFARREGKEITISRLGTNFEDIEDYFNDLVNKNNLKIIKKDRSKLSGQDAIVVYIPDSNNSKKTQKLYYFYVYSAVYSLSTSSEEFFDDLDQIAQSFRYTP